MREPLYRYYPWDYWDWSGEPYDFCECEGCELCELQSQWWAEISPYLPFEASDLVHLTRAEDYMSICGDARLSTIMASTDQVTTYREVARVQHHPVTCVACLAGWNPQTDFL